MQPVVEVIGEVIQRFRISAQSSGTVCLLVFECVADRGMHICRSDSIFSRLEAHWYHSRKIAMQGQCLDCRRNVTALFIDIEWAAVVDYVSDYRNVLIIHV